MDVTVVLWLFGALIGILSSVTGGIVAAIWILFRMLTDFRLEVAREYHTAGEVEKAVERAVQPVLQRLGTMETLFMERMRHANVSGIEPSRNSQQQSRQHPP
jgi:hypothetical protein